MWLVFGGKEFKDDKRTLGSYEVADLSIVFIVLRKKGLGRSTQEGVPAKREEVVEEKKEGDGKGEKIVGALALGGVLVTACYFLFAPPKKKKPRRNKTSPAPSKQAHGSSPAA